MSLTNISISTADLGLAVAITPVVINLVSNKSGIWDTGTGQDIQRTRSANTNASGLLTIGIEANSTLSDTTSTYTFTIGGNIYAGIVVPVSGSTVTLISLVPSSTVVTVVVSYTSYDPSGAPVNGESVTAQLSVSGTDSFGNLINAGRVVNGTTDVTGHGTINLERTDQITVPGMPGYEPYYAIAIGGNTYYKYVRSGGGNLTALVDAIPASLTGGVAASATSIGASGTLPGALIGSPATVQDFISNLLFVDEFGNLEVRTVTANDTATNADDVVLVDATVGSTTETIPTAIGQVKFLYVCKKDSSAHTVTLSPAVGGQLINGAATYVITAQNTGVLLFSDNVNWFAIPIGATGSGGSSAFSFVAKTTNYNITSSDTGIAGDGTSASVALTLPTAIGATSLIAVKAINLAHAVTLAPVIGGQTIDGVSLLTFTNVEEVFLFASDGANWQIVSGYVPSVITGKGDLVAGLSGGGVVRLPVSGTNGNVLTEDSTQAAGLKFAPPAVGKIYGPLVDSGGLMIRDSAGTPILAAR